ncbi:hypothetical protein I4F81_012342 [Pyropia yezoensis]|uniref:Uncharacterized protein n=1 Tax=Pyropia yezoensis TaxID=2788 RepID=A0ACC3CJE8_PYRYE|nr:hypothetical protein I4F81_012342 [Neopyropia yezoensis]
MGNARAARADLSVFAVRLRLDGRFLDFRGIPTTRLGTEGNQGRASGNGARGGTGGAGGAGGAGGRVVLVEASVNGPPLVVARIFGGAGGGGGAGGRGGSGGPNLPAFRKVTRCRCSGFLCTRCRFTTTTITRPRTRSGSTGRRGPAGPAGAPGALVRQTPATVAATDVPRGDLRLWVGLLERFYVDLLLTLQGAPAASPASAATKAAAMEVTAAVERAAPGLPFPQRMMAATGARVQDSRAEAGAGIFGRAALTRTSPGALADVLDDQYAYAQRVADTASRATAEANLLSVVTAAAAISLPAKNFQAIRRSLRDRRTLQVLAVDRIQEEIAVALAEAATRLSAAQAEAVELAGERQLNQFFSLLSAGAGLGGAVAGKDPFAAIQSVVEIQEVVREIVDEATASGCSIGGLADLLNAGADLDLRNNFPGVVDLSADLSLIQSVDTIAAIRSAALESKAAELTAQIACAFAADDFSTLPEVKAAFERLFINAQARVDLIDTILDIDVELAALTVEAASLTAQREELQRLIRGGQGALARADAVEALQAQYEVARLGALEGLAATAASFKQVSLIDFGDVLAAFARRRLEANGVLPVAVDMLALDAARATLFRVFRRTAVCLGELPDRRFFFFDVPVNPLNTSAVASGGGPPPVLLRSGAAVKFPFTLSFFGDCGAFGRTSPPTRNLPAGTTSNGCAPNRNRFNTRMVSMGVELLGGDDALLPPGRTAVAAFVDQVGRQTFRRSFVDIVSYDAASLLVPLADAPLATGAPLALRPFCERRTSAVSFLDTPRACPSPFSSYLLQLGRFPSAPLDSYLRTVQTVRVHALLSSSSSLCLPERRLGSTGPDREAVTRGRVIIAPPTSTAQ